MERKDRRFTSTCLIVMLSLALPVWSDTTRVEDSRGADRGKEQIAALLRDLDLDAAVDHERIVRFLLGIGDSDKIDKKQIATLLGIDDVEKTSYEEILRVLLGLADDDKPLENEQIARLLLGIRDDDDAIDREQIDRLMHGHGDPSGGG